MMKTYFIEFVYSHVYIYEFFDIYWHLLHVKKLKKKINIFSIALKLVYTACAVVRVMYDFTIHHRLCVGEKLTDENSRFTTKKALFLC